MEHLTSREKKIEKMMMMIKIMLTILMTFDVVSSNATFEVTSISLTHVTAYIRVFPYVHAIKGDVSNIQMKHDAPFEPSDWWLSIPCRELTYPLPAGTFVSMIFLFPRRDMLVFCRVGELGEPSKTRRAYAGIYHIISYDII